MDDYEYPIILSPYMLVIPGVDFALAWLLRQRADECLNHIAQVDGCVFDNNPALIIAIDMDECFEFTANARAN